MPAQLSPSCLETEQVGDTLVMRLTRHELVDDPIIWRVGDEMTRLTQEFGYHRLVLDLGEVQRMSSSMIARFLAVARKAKTAGGRLVLCQVRPEVAEVFTILRLADLLPVYATEADALLSF